MESTEKQQQEPVSNTRKTASRQPHKPLDALSFLELDKDLTPNEINFRLHARKVCEEQVMPLAAKQWEEGRFDRTLIQASKDIGPAGLQIKGYGCAGLSSVCSVLLIMEEARADASFATFNLVHSALVMKTLQIAGTEKQKNMWLPKMARWEAIGSFALTEPLHGSDARNLKTNIKKVENGFKLNGEKCWIGNASFADIIIVWAYNQDNKLIEGVIVERGMRGLTTKIIEGKCCLRGVENCLLIFNNCFIPEANKLKEGGFNDVHQILFSSRAFVAAAATGLLVGSYDCAVSYANNRIQFNRRISSFQLIQEKLMRALAMTNACVSITLQLGRRLDQGCSSLPLIALVKATTTLLSREGVRICREIMGANGILLKYLPARAIADIEVRLD